MAARQILAPVVALLMGGSALAQNAAPLSARNSDPRVLGWMQGFPPAPDKTIRFTDPDYFSFPKLRWTVCHFRELMPTEGVDDGAGKVRALPVMLKRGLDDVAFQPMSDTGRMTWGQAFDANYTDGVIVLHHGRIVYERYAGCLNPQMLHGAMSVTKSLTDSWPKR